MSKHPAPRSKSKSTIRALIKRPGLVPEPVDLPNTLDALQAAVEGYIGIAIKDHTDAGAAVIVWCNDEAVVDGLPLNLARLTDGTPIFGAVVVTGSAGEDNADLTPAQEARWMAILVASDATMPDAWKARLLDELVPKLPPEARVLVMRARAQALGSVRHEVHL